MSQAAKNTQDASSLVEMVQLVHRHLPQYWKSFKPEEDKGDLQPPTKDPNKDLPRATKDLFLVLIKTAIVLMRYADKKYVIRFLTSGAEMDRFSELKSRIEKLMLVGHMR
jgi:hypothetical protein